MDLLMKPSLKKLGMILAPTTSFLSTAKPEKPSSKHLVCLKNRQSQFLPFSERDGKRRRKGEEER
jgi:hypothetical protein